MTPAESAETSIPQLSKKPSILSCGMFLGLYLLLIFPSVFFVFLSVNFLRLDHVSVSLLVACYFSIVITFYAIMGILNANDECRPLHHWRTVLPMMLLGALIWCISLWGQGQVRSQYDDLPWVWYKLYTMWAVPILEYLKMNKYISGGTLPLVGLSATLIPGVAYVSGIYMRKHYDKYEKKLLVKAVILIPVLFLTAFGLSTVLPRHTMFTEATYPRIDGATAAKPFGALLAKELVGLNAWQAENKARFSTTHKAYVNLIDRKTDIIFVAGPSDEEIKLAAERGVQLKLTPIGKDAFIFLVHRENAVKNLTIKQLQDIYSGKVNNWEPLGGKNTSIIAYQREKNSGSQTYMETKVMKGEKFTKAPMERVQQFMDGLISVVADYKNSQNSIGYSFYYYANEMQRNEHVKFLSIESIECTKANIKSDAYPFTAVLYAVTRADEPEDSSATKLLKWLSTASGKSAVERGGFIPIQ